MRARRREPWRGFWISGCGPLLTLVPLLHLQRACPVILIHVRAPFLLAISTSWLVGPFPSTFLLRLYPQFPGRGESCIRPALVLQGRSQGSPLLKGHRQLQTALSYKPNTSFIE